MKKSIRNPYGYIHTYKRGASVKFHFPSMSDLLRNVVPSVEVPGFKLEYHQAKNNLFMNSNSYHGANVFFTLHFSLVSFCLCQSFPRFKLWPNSWLRRSAFAMDIKPGPGRVSSSLNLSVSSSLSRSEPSSTGTSAKVKQLKPFATEDIRILLLENINETGRDILSNQGYQVEALKTSLSEDELIEKIRWNYTPLLANSGMASN